MIGLGKIGVGVLPLLIVSVILYYILMLTMFKYGKFTFIQSYFLPTLIIYGILFVIELISKGTLLSKKSVLNEIYELIKYGIAKPFISIIKAIISLIVNILSSAYFIIWYLPINIIATILK